VNNIGEIYFEDEITQAYFSCDLEKCKGACCTFPGIYGAPILNEEVEILTQIFQYVKDYLAPYSLNYIQKHGLIQGSEDNYSTMCINNRDCVFVYYEKDIAKCSIERAYLDGKIAFRKPISCHLYPIRCWRNGSLYLYYDKIEECNPGVLKGKEKKVLLITSLQESLERAFSKTWYDKLIKFSNGNLETEI